MSGPRRPRAGTAVGRRAAASIAALLALALAPPAGAADEVIAPGHVVELGSLDAARGVQVWLRWDGHRFRLVQRIGGEVGDAPVPAFEPVRGGGEDDRGLPGSEGLPDLGTDRRGRLVAVYHRCRGRGSRLDCDVYAYAPGSARPERRVGHASSRACRERMPAMWRGVVVLTRGARRAGCRPGLWVVRPDGRERRLRPTRPGLEPDHVFVSDTDIRGRRVLAAVTGVTAEAEATGLDTDIALLRTYGGRARAIASGSFVDNAEAGEQAGSEVAAPKLDGRHALWTRRCYRVDADQGNLASTADLVRLDLSRRRARPLAMAPRAESRAIAAFAVDGASVFYALGESPDGVRRASDPPRSFTGRACDGGR